MLIQCLRLLSAMVFLVAANFALAAKVITYSPPDFIPDQIVSDDATIYLLSRANKQVYRWSIATSTYLSPMPIGFSRDSIEYTPTNIELSLKHGRLYLGYETGDIRYIALKGSITERNFAVISLPVRQLVAVSTFLYAEDGDQPYEGNRYLLNSRGAVTDQNTVYPNYENVWSSADSRLYQVNGNQVSYTVIDQKTGKFAWDSWYGFYSSNYSYGYEGYQNLSSLLSLSSDSRFLLANDGTIRDSKQGLSSVVNLSQNLIRGKLLADGSVVTVSLLNFWSSPEQFHLEMRDPSLRLLEQIDYSGILLGIYGSVSKISLAVIQNGKFSIQTYVLNPDSDGDGVLNKVDAFPMDPAASRDSDKDGYPDAWNRGKDQSFSTSGLVLDAYPKDAECYLLPQGDGKLCNYGLTVPMFTPDDVIFDGKIVYLLSVSNKKIYRWSIDTAKYLSPIRAGFTSGYVDLFPTKLVFSSEQARIYLGYENGTISYLLPGKTTGEKTLASVESGIKQLVAVGKFLLVQEKNNYQKTVFDIKGVQKDKGQQYINIKYSSWNSASSRLYFLQDSNVPQFHYLSVNKTSGKLSTVTSSAYQSSKYFGSMINVSNDNARIFLGNSEIYSAKDLTTERTLGQTSDESRWMADGSLVRLQRKAAQIVLQRFNKNFELVEELVLDGSSIVGLFGTDKKMYVLAMDSGQLVSYTYVPKDDSDGDKVPNHLDAFPNDPSASVDSDNDGYPDRWNTGFNASTSTTGLMLDAYPNDAACYLPEHGNGSQCDYMSTLPEFIPDQIVADDKTIYMLSRSNQKIYRWSIAAGNYINPLNIGIQSGNTRLAPTKIALSSAHQRIYLAYSSGEINYVDIVSGTKERLFARTPSSIGGLAAVGNYLLAQDPTGAWVSHHIFDQAGNLTDSQDWNYYSSEYTWDAVNSRVYFFRDDTSPNDLHYEVIDQHTGKITASGETPYHGDYYIRPPIRVSANGEQVILGSGDIYRAPALTWETAIGISLTDARWLADGSLVTLSESENETLLQHRAADQILVEQLTFNGLPLGIFGSDDAMVVMVLESARPIGHYYQPSDDSDGDGVQNNLDAFPVDSAASLDTDNDGYPDQWNAGYSASDSSTGLQLDAYPNDTACYLVAHGDGVNCDYSATMPQFTPDQILSDANIIYLLSRTNKKVYRWSISDKKYINPLVVGIKRGATVDAPTKMALSPQQNRLYFGYDSGAVTFIAQNEIKEHAFANTAMSVRGLAAVGNYLLAQDNSGAWARHYIFDVDGAITDQRDWNYYSHEYAWDAEKSRVYFFRDDTSPNDLLYEVIDQTTGKIIDRGETPYHGDYPIYGVIRVSTDGNRVLIGSGDIYTLPNLIHEGSLQISVTDAIWMDSVLITIEGDLLKLRSDENFSVLQTFELHGTPLKIIQQGINIIVVQVEDGAFTYTQFNIGDNDADGLPKWWEDMYGFDDEYAGDAILDSDGDGLSNLEEYSHHTKANQQDSDADGINDGEEVNIYGTNPIASDTDGDGLNDYDELFVYETNPIQKDSDEDSFSDYLEVIVYATDPNDSASVPPSITLLNESFEANTLSPLWFAGLDSDANWTIDTTVALSGSQSIRSGVIGNSQRSSVGYSGLFAAGVLSFSVKVDAEHCCDRLELYVDDVYVGASYNSSWHQMSVPLTAGNHQLEWRYVKDGSVAYGADAVWIDDLSFIAD
jgi:hypothetical protein